MYGTFLWSMPDGKRLSFSDLYLKAIETPFSADSKRLAMRGPIEELRLPLQMGRDGVCIRRVPSGEIVFRKQLDAAMYDIALSPDGRTPAVRTASKITLIEALTGQERAHFPDHTEWGRMVFSPDGRRLAATDGLQKYTSNPKSFRIYDLALEKEVAPVSSQRFVDLAFSPDGRRLATASPDGTVLVWDAGK
jgi:WD40 repeat protein